jgi:predicted DNA-binding transcriptional regulator AlpA
MKRCHEHGRSLEHCGFLHHGNLPLLLTSGQVAAWLGISTRTLWRMVGENNLPQPIRHNRKLVRWKAEEVRRHIEGTV